MASVEFNYEGRNIIIQCNKYDTMGKIFRNFTSKASVNPNSIVFLYNGTSISNQNLTFDQLSNIDDKKRNKMNILVTNALLSSSPKFIFLAEEGADESMKDYAKMTILLALQEYPDDHPKKSQLIKNKFDEKYGGCWLCSFVKEGGTTFTYHNPGNYR